MAVRAISDESALRGASAAFLRSMLGIGGRLLADMAGDVAPRSTLQMLSESARDLLGAAHVTLHLAASTGMVTDDLSIASGEHSDAGPSQLVAVGSAGRNALWSR